MASITGTSANNVLNNIYSAAANSANAANTQNSSASNQDGVDPLANKSTFLTLLVAQLKNQDPSQPADGMQFVTQLAQFSSLEQNLAMRQDLDSINSKMPGAASPSSVTPAKN